MMHNLPKVTIAMAIFKPEVKFFQEQLYSLNNQDYKGEVELLVWNDSPNDFICEPYLQQIIKKFPYYVLSNGKNNGATVAFEFLTTAANGEYIAFCDQDDIWRPSKITASVQWMEQHPDCTVVHVGVCFINSSNKIIKSDLYGNKVDLLNDSKLQKRKFVLDNQSYGCAMLMKTQCAKNARPFPRMIYHDQWLILYATFFGKVTFLSEILLEHRIHGNNNSQMLFGIVSARDYYERKLKKDYEFIHYLSHRFPCETYYLDIINWIDTRKAWADDRTWNNFTRMVRKLHIRGDIVLFELIIAFFPDVLFHYLIKLSRFIRGI